MNAAEKVARHRLSVLELATALGNMSQACRQRGMTRTQFYEYKRRFQPQAVSLCHTVSGDGSLSHSKFNRR
jgi:DNA-binding phage protein